MKEGLLWFDNDPQRKLTDKIAQAATRYASKFGRKPTVCYTNPKDFAAHQAQVGDGLPVETAGVQVEARRNVLPHHFWVGVENEVKLMAGVGR